ncbi:MAG: hypothetical protein WCG25_01340 [bacterium]
MKQNKQKKIYFPEQEELVKALCEVLFHDLISRSYSERANDKIRIGMQVCIREKNYANEINIPISLVSETDREYFLKSNFSPEVAKLTFYLPGQTIEIIVDGLLEKENIAIAMIVVSRITKIATCKLICNLRKNEVKLPSCLCRKGHYLKTFLDYYQ